MIFLYCVQQGILSRDCHLVQPITIPQCTALCTAWYFLIGQTTSQSSQSEYHNTPSVTHNKLTACSFFSFFCSNCSICENLHFNIISKHAQIFHADALNIKVNQYFLSLFCSNCSICEKFVIKLDIQPSSMHYLSVVHKLCRNIAV